MIVQTLAQPISPPDCPKRPESQKTQGQTPRRATLELKIGVAMVGSSRVNAVLIRDDLPELRSDLVSAPRARTASEEEEEGA